MLNEMRWRPSTGLVWNKTRDLIDDRDLIPSRVGANRDWRNCNGALLRRKLSDGRGVGTLDDLVRFEACVSPLLRDST